MVFHSDFRSRYECCSISCRRFKTPNCFYIFLDFYSENWARKKHPVGSTWFPLCQGFHRRTAQGEHLWSLCRSGEAPWRGWFVPRFANAKCVACRGLVRGGRWPRILRMGWPAGNLPQNAHGNVWIYIYTIYICLYSRLAELYKQVKVKNVDRLFGDDYFLHFFAQIPAQANHNGPMNSIVAISTRNVHGLC